MNYFILAAGILYLAGAAQYFYRGSWELGIAFIAYSVANFAFMNL